MASTSEYRDMLRGPMRQWMKDAGGETKWVDDFCDGLLLRLIQPEDNMKIHLWASRKSDVTGARLFQVNIDIHSTGAYTNDVTSDPLGIIGEKLAPIHNELVCSSDAGEEGAGS